MTEEDQVNNLMIDMGAALAGSIPYVGGCAAVTISYFKKGEDVITWDDIKNYVDAKIEEEKIKERIRNIQNQISSLRLDLDSYVEYADKIEGYPDTDRWDQLEIMWDKANDVNKTLLQLEGYGSDFYEDSGVWKSSPWQVSNPASVILALSITITIEMTNLVKRGNIPNMSGRIEQVVKQILTPYNKALKLLITDAYSDRMSMIKVVDAMKKHTDKYPTSTGGTKTSSYYHFNFNWHDDYNPDVGAKIDKSVDANKKERKKMEAKTAPLRVDLLNYQLQVHQESVDTLFNTLISPLNDFHAYHAAISEDERNSRKSTGLMYGGAKAKISTYYSDAHKGSIETTMYFSDEAWFVPVMQFDKEGDDHFNTWTFGASEGYNSETETVIPKAKLGIMRYYNDFDPKYNSESISLVWNESEASENGYVMVKTTGDDWGASWVKSNVKWYAPIDPTKPK